MAEWFIEILETTLTGHQVNVAIGRIFPIIPKDAVALSMMNEVDSIQRNGKPQELNVGWPLSMGIEISLSRSRISGQ